jgi:hypothetical protein
MARPIRITQFRPDREDAAVYLRRTWAGPAVVLGDDPWAVIVTDVPEKATIPLGENMGSVSREAAAVSLRKKTPYVADVYVVEVSSPAGVRSYGMFAVPQATEPLFGVW